MCLWLEFWLGGECLGEDAYKGKGFGDSYGEHRDGGLASEK